METANSPASKNEIDLKDLLLWVWSRKVLFAICVFIGAAVLVSYSYVIPKQYSAQVVLLPRIPVQKAGILGPLASLTGTTMDLEGVDEELYGRILHSNLVLDPILSQRWPGETTQDSLTLHELFGFGGMIEERGQAYADYHLKNILRFQVIKFDRDPMNGVMNIKTTVPEKPALAAALANYLADELEAYNSKLNNQRKVKVRDFVGNRLEEVQEKLEAAESAKAVFLLNNKSYTSSPKLMQRHGELDREVQALRSIWLQLRSRLENANIDVNEKIESINILDRATTPFHRSAPKRWIYLFTGASLGFIAAVVLAKLRQFYVK
jgi:uncharacterized protein involved in exopolysaccharide biosynthesis